MEAVWFSAMLSVVVMPVWKKMLCVQKHIIRKCGGLRIAVYKQPVIIRVIFFGVSWAWLIIGLHLSCFYWWSDVKVMPVIIRYLCLLFESRFIVGLEQQNEGFKVSKHHTSVMSFIEMKSLLLPHWSWGWFQLSQKLIHKASSFNHSSPQNPF